MDTLSVRVVAGPLSGCRGTVQAKNGKLCEPLLLGEIRGTEVWVKEYSNGWKSYHWANVIAE